MCLPTACGERMHSPPRRIKRQDGDAASCQITLKTCLHYHHHYYLEKPIVDSCTQHRTAFKYSFIFFWIFRTYHDPFVLPSYSRQLYSYILRTSDRYIYACFGKTIDMRTHNVGDLEHLLVGWLLKEIVNLTMDTVVCLVAKRYDIT